MRIGWWKKQRSRRRRKEGTEQQHKSKAKQTRRPWDKTLHRGSMTIGEDMKKYYLNHDSQNSFPFFCDFRVSYPFLTSFCHGKFFQTIAEKSNQIRGEFVDNLFSDKIILRLKVAPQCCSLISPINLIAQFNWWIPSHK